MSTPDSSSSPRPDPPGAASSTPDETPEASDLPSLRWLGIGVVVILVTALTLPKLLSSDDAQASGPPQGSTPAMGVDVVVAQPAPIRNRVQTNGTIRADESVELTSESAGKITRILFEEGARVQKGALLVQINDAELQAQRERLEYQLDLARQRAERQAKILERGGVSQEAYDETVNDVNVLSAELKLVEAQIAKTQVRAPFSGTVGLRQVSEGSYLTPQTPIATLHRVRPVKIDLAVPEQYAGQVSTGQPITFRVRGHSGTFDGKVYAIEPQINPNTRTLQLRARADNADGVLRAGAFADVTVELGLNQDALVVPAFAVVPSLGSQRLFVLQDGTARVRTVSLGLRSSETVQITDGIAPGDTVITSGIQDLRDGLEVRVESVKDVPTPATPDV